MTIARKLWLGFGILILLCVLAGLIVLLSQRSTDRAIDNMARVEQPTQIAASEMEINVVEIGRDVLGYLETRDPAYRERFGRDVADFEDAEERYIDLTTTGGSGRDRVIIVYDEQYESLGRSLMSDSDELHALTQQSKERFRRLDALVEEELASVDQGTPAGRRKATVLREIDDEATEASVALQDYLDDPRSGDRRAELEGVPGGEVQAQATRQLNGAIGAANRSACNVVVTIVLLLVGGLTLGLLAAGMIRRGILGSVRRLETGARRVGRGELEHKIEPYADDELGAVALAFNEMLDRRRQHEAALREAEERYRTTVEHTPAITYTEIVNGSGGEPYVSPQVERILGYAQGEMIDYPDLWKARVHPEDRRTFDAANGRADETEEPLEVEYRMLHKDGRVVWVCDKAVPVRGEDGRCTGRGWSRISLSARGPSGSCRRPRPATAPSLSRSRPSPTSRSSSTGARSCTRAPR